MRSQLACLDWRIDWGPLVGDLSTIPQHRVCCVLGGLDTTIGQGDHVLTSHSTRSILGLRLLEAVVCRGILHPVLVAIWLVGEVLGLVGWRGWS